MMNLRKKYPQGCPRRGEDEHPNRMDSMVLDQGNGQMNTSKQCTCGKICKNERGLKIHQGKIKCLVGIGPTQRTGVQPGEMQEEPGLVSPRSARNLQVLQMTPSSIKSERRRIKWPAANMTSLWNRFWRPRWGEMLTGKCKPWQRSSSASHPKGSVKRWRKVAP